MFDARTNLKSQVFQIQLATAELPHDYTILVEPGIAETGFY